MKKMLVLLVMLASLGAMAHPKDVYETHDVYTDAGIMMRYFCMDEFVEIFEFEFYKFAEDGSIELEEPSGDIEIPATVDGKVVSGIYDFTFYRCSGLTSVKMPGSISYIGYCAFEDCSELKGMTIPNSMVRIRNGAFWGCNEALFDMTTVPGVQLIDGLAIMANGSLSGALDLTGVRGVGEGVFEDCTGLTNLIIGDDMTSIGASAFANCFRITSVTVGTNVTYVGDCAFEGCYGITNVYICDLAAWCGITFEGSLANPLSCVDCYDPEDIWSYDDPGIHKTTNIYVGDELISDLIIPDGVNGIGAYAFVKCDGLTSVTMPDSVRGIGDGAFWGCKGLKNVVMGNAVENIGEDAFGDCGALTSVTMPDSVTIIGGGAFANCRNLIGVVIPDGVTSIGEDAFCHCDRLTNVTIPESVWKIGPYAFSYCSAITNVTIGRGMDRISNGLFRGCKSLNSIVIPEGIVAIGYEAFAGCKNLTNVIMPGSVEEIGWDAFRDCGKIRNITVPQCLCSCGYMIWDIFRDSYEALTKVGFADNVTYIASSAFGGCQSLKEIVLPDGVYIEDYAFSDCYNLEKITMSGTEQSFGGYAFCCTDDDGAPLPWNGKLANVEMLITNYGYVRLADMFPMFYREITNVTLSSGSICVNSSLFEDCRGLKNVVIPDGVECIEYGAFSGCSGLANVTIPDSVTSIRPDVFSGCSDSLYDLTTIPGVKLVDGWVVGYTDLPSSDLDLTGVRGVGDEAFEDCSGLTSVTIHDGVTSIGMGAFSGCSGLTRVTIPNSVTSIDFSAFSGCSGLMSFEVGVDNPNYSSVNGLLLTKDGKTLIRGVNGNVTIPDSVMHISWNAFSRCSGLTCVTIGSGVTSIGDWAFYCCTNLTSVTMPDSVTSIGAYAFYGCSGLTNMVIPNSVTFIGTSAFDDCTGLSNVTIPQCLCSSGRLASFFRVHDETSFTNAIITNPSITNVTIASGVTRIGDYVFADWNGLKSVVVPSSVTRIGDNAFKDCASLESLVFEGDVPDVGATVLLGTPRRLEVKVQDGTIGWAGGDSTGLPSSWCDRGIAYVGGTGGGSGGGSSSGGGGSASGNDARYELSDSAKDRAIASVTVDGDCAIDEFVMVDGKVYDSVVRIVNTASKSVRITLPDGYTYETFKGTKPLTIPASSRNILTITRTADKTFLVSRRELETAQ